MARYRALRALILIAALAAQPALAQVNEADRLARCRNNREALARLEAAQSGLASEEQIARARTALTSIQAMETQIDRNFQQATLDLEHLAQLRNRPAQSDTATEIAQTEARLQEYTRDNMAVAERIRSAAAPFGVNCLAGDYACERQIYRRLGQAIDASVAQRAQNTAALQQAQIYRTNLIALRCMAPGETMIGAGPTSPPLSGADANVATIRGRYYAGEPSRYYQVAQDGTNFTFQSEDGTESGSGTITVLPLYQRLTATVNGPRGTRTVTGIITMSGVDRTQVWELSWYGGYGSWQRRQQ